MSPARPPEGARSLLEGQGRRPKGVLFTPARPPEGARSPATGCGWAVAWTIAYLLCSGSPASAQALAWSGEVALSSDMTDRGISPWLNSPIAQGVVALSDTTHWVASLSAAAALDRGHSSQLAARAAGYWNLSQDWQLQTRLVFYTYPQSQHSWPYERTEGTLGGSYRDLASLEYSWVRLSEGDSRLYPAIDLGLRWPLAEQWSLAAGLGSAELAAWPGLHYRYADAGVVWRDGPWRASLRYLWTGQPVRGLFGEFAQPHISATVAWGF
jgi:hypothetical protein